MDKQTFYFRIQKTVNEMLRDRGYVVSDAVFRETLDQFRERWPGSADSFVLTASDPLDEQNIIYVFFTEEKLNSKGLSGIIANLESKNSKKCIIVAHGQPTAIIKKQAKQYLEEKGIRVELFEDDELVINITHHSLVPKHEIVSESEKKAILTKYRVNEAQLPRILQTDPVARYLGLLPGQLVRITRPSETAGEHITYRVCV